MVGGIAGQNALHAAGSQAAHIANVWWIFFWTCTAFYVVLMVFFVIALLRGRRNSAPDITAQILTG